ncbi:MAG: hypothetical protein UX81_C0010G0013 [Parcubacteria group bacterium GW2011_GWA2_47_12]|nr:MAG: hypothetical protein UX81_C0010G0013 [Parcubacteria group bacterium GW2011_GWA2_47_12]
MKIRFTKHALEKFEVLKQHRILVSRNRVLNTVIAPEYTDHRRAPLVIAQSTLDINRVLRVVYKKEQDDIKIITFYPGRKSQYEK